MLASIVIRTKNESRLLGRTLDAIKAQESPSFEVVLVDSGSTDSTLAIARRYPFVRIVEIEPKKFTYGRSLNVGIQKASGRYIVALSGHSIPLGSKWLSSLVSGLEDSSVAGVYGKQVPFEDCNPLERRAIKARFTDTPRLQTSDPFFSNANSAVRRELVVRYPFDETLQGAEDYEWAKRMQQLGYRIRYEPGAAVLHSHNENLEEVYRRWWREAAALAAVEPNLAPGLGQCLLWWCRGTLVDVTYVALTRKALKWWLAAPQRRWAMAFGRYQGFREALRCSKRP